MQKALTLAVLSFLSLFPALGQKMPEYRFFVEPAQRYLKAAEQGDSRGLAQVAQRYLKGDGVAQDYEEFARQVSVAAQEGNQWAQLMLGLAYIAGRGVPGDLVLAHMWSNVAAAGGDENLAAMAREQRNVITEGMSTRQIARAQELARGWKPKRDLEKNASAEKRGRWAFWRR